MHDVHCISYEIESRLFWLPTKMTQFILQTFLYVKFNDALLTNHGYLQRYNLQRHLMIECFFLIEQWGLYKDISSICPIVVIGQ